jgi:hypothetical protein
MAHTIKLGAKVIFTPRDMNLNLLPTREAWVISFEGFESFTFRLYKMDGCWAIGELSTGLPIVRGHGSKYEANDKAIYELGRRGVEATRKAIAATLDRITDRGVTGLPAGCSIGHVAA